MYLPYCNIVILKSDRKHLTDMHMLSSMEPYQTKEDDRLRKLPSITFRLIKAPLIFSLNPELKSAANIYSDLNSTKNLNDLSQKKDYFNQIFEADMFRLVDVRRNSRTMKAILKIVITGINYGHLREDGINIIPIGCIRD